MPSSQDDPSVSIDPVETPVSLGQIFLTSLILGLTSFGGPVAHLGYYERTYVRQKKWLSADAYSHLVALCQLLPGPGSSQVNFLLGWRKGGPAGALLSWLGFTLPSALIMFGFAVLTPRLNSPYLEPILHGLKLVAVAVVAQAVWSMAPKLCPDKARAGIAIVAFAALLFSVQAWMQIGVLVAGAITGLILCRHVRQVEGVQIAFIGKRIAIAAGFTFLILLAVLPVWAHFSPDRFAQVLATTYSSGALVFGGGHVVLPLLHDAMVPTHLVSNNQFLAGYGVAQALPGPLFSFGAYLGATAAPTGQAALWAAMATLFIFLPGLLVSVAGVPLWQWLSRHEGAQGAFAGVNAAVVGLLSAALYSPVFTSAVFNGIDLAIAAIGFVFLEKWRAPPLLVVLLLVASTFAMRALGFG